MMELGQWIDKTDGAEDSDIEAVKGGLSDAFKRAAVKWNIGRYLYSFNTVWVAAEARGNSYVIPESENAKLEKAYNDTVARMFGTPAPKQTTTQPPQKTEYTTSTRTAEASGNSASCICNYTVSEQR